MNTLLQLLDKGATQILAPLQRFPITSFSAFIFILVTSIKMSSELNHITLGSYNEVLKQISMVTFFGFFLLLGLRLMSRNIVVSLLGIVLLVVTYFYLPERLIDEEPIYYFVALLGLSSSITIYNS